MTLHGAVVPESVRTGKDEEGEVDPYLALLDAGDVLIACTGSRANTATPSWEEEFIVALPSGRLRLVLVDSDHPQKRGDNLDSGDCYLVKDGTHTVKLKEGSRVRISVKTIR